MENFDSIDISHQVLKELLKYRRCFSQSNECDEYEERKVSEIQIPRIRAFIEKSQPIEFILPAFPTKSPNPKKVLGKIPDMAEKLSLVFLNSLCQKIKDIYSLGAKIIICSDGHVFSDLICVDDNDITLYQKELNKLLSKLDGESLYLYSLSSVKELTQYSQDYTQLRSLLVKNYATSIDEIKGELKQTNGGIQLYQAITRFLYEDSFLPDYTGSKAALQRNAKQRAVGVIQRSRAWGNLLSTKFPSAIRLSIHPQPADSIKMGIHLMPTRDNWLTPWHGVAVNINGRFILMKNETVKKMNGKLVEVDGSPSHYVIESI